jgi:hypothetical protein
MKKTRNVVRRQNIQKLHYRRNKGIRTYFSWQSKDSVMNETTISCLKRKGGVKGI